MHKCHLCVFNRVILWTEPSQRTIPNLNTAPLYYVMFSVVVATQTHRRELPLTMYIVHIVLDNSECHEQVHLCVSSAFEHLC